MIRAVIFDMFETLITHYQSPLYFGMQMAEDAGISNDKFQALWKATEYNRTIGEITLEEVLEMIFKKNNCYSQKLLEDITEKRINAKRECFHHLHKEIIPMLSKIKEKGLFIGLISNCFSEEAKVIRESELFSYFDAAFLSCEQGVQKPEEEIFKRCIKALSVRAEECLYIGDGGSHELEAAEKLGMKAVQAVWYLQKRKRLPIKGKQTISLCETPLMVLDYLDEEVMSEIEPHS